MPERRSSFCYSRGLAACCCVGGQRRHHFDRPPRRRRSRRRFLMGRNTDGRRGRLGGGRHGDGGGGDYVSVSSQADSEAADLEHEQRALEDYPAYETLELAEIYERRGLTPPLARRVAEQLMAKDALSAHARDELGFSDGAGANPILAAFASAISFSLGAAMPTLAALVARPASTARSRCEEPLRMTPSGAVTLPCEEHERSTPYGSLSRRALSRCVALAVRWVVR